MFSVDFVLMSSFYDLIVVYLDMEVDLLFEVLSFCHPFDDDDDDGDD